MRPAARVVVLLDERVGSDIGVRRGVMQQRDERDVTCLELKPCPYKMMLEQVFVVDVEARASISHIRQHCGIRRIHSSSVLRFQGTSAQPQASRPLAEPWRGVTHHRGGTRPRAHLTHLRNSTSNYTSTSLILHQNTNLRHLAVATASKLHTYTISTDAPAARHCLQDANFQACRQCQVSLPWNPKPPDLGV